jgi:vancomycin resistance protein VanJ
LALFIRRMRLPVFLSAAWFAWPLAGLCLGGLTPGGTGDEDSTVRVLTCNVGQGGYDEERLAELILDVDPHVVTLQESFSVARLKELLGPRWRIVSSPGILLATRLPIISREVFTGSQASIWRTVAVDYRLDSASGSFDFVAVHLYTPRKGLEAMKDTYWRGIDGMHENLERRDRESADCSRWVAELPEPAIVAGDMNLPPESFIFRRDWSAYRDAFAAAGLGYGYTYGYTKSGRLYGIRIDHVLASPEWKVIRSWVGPHVGSDHRPLIAELRRSTD